MQIEKTNLEHNLKAIVDSGTDIIRLFITNEIFENTFGYSFSNVTDFLGQLASTHGLEISAKKMDDMGINVTFRKDPYQESRYKKEEVTKRLE